MAVAKSALASALGWTAVACLAAAWGAVPVSATGVGEVHGARQASLDVGRSVSRQHRDVRTTLEANYRAWSAAEKLKDVPAYMAFIAPGFVAVGQAGNTFDRRQLEAFARENAATMNVIAQAYQIDSLAVVDSTATVSVRHSLSVRMRGDTVNGRRVEAKPLHHVLVRERMRQTWVKHGESWMLKHWTDISGKIWVDGKLTESFGK